MFPTRKMPFEGPKQIFAALHQIALDFAIGAPHITHVAPQQGRWSRDGAP
jgi:hypothetical protein